MHIDVICGSVVSAVASEQLRGNREIVLAAVRECGRASPLNGVVYNPLNGEGSLVEGTAPVGGPLRFASTDMRADKEIVLEAVRVVGSALRFASDDLCADIDVALAAVGQSGDVLECAAHTPRPPHPSHAVTCLLGGLEACRYMPTSHAAPSPPTPLAHIPHTRMPICTPI